MKVLETIWLTGMYGHVGIVLGEDSITGERKVYIGVHRGQDEGSDRELIVSGGSKVPGQMIDRIQRHLNKDEEGSHDVD